ncbi:hypothetical protein DS891_14225 [Pseudoalteromonas sp. JC28]|uniref:hypothetical protein n=1 Tax=unclassified Pseudoalteromonas TaxID=194690 RepID=UPI001573C20E|nr:MULTISPECIES: hypothetical protein [unclassified Pseudoalteromonas]MCF2826804.1 hypothetical protein [Pseudoalteromonas sp. OF5H-5]MCF2833637.1 hypothetical protein [Pseudoalteromonas sp. DL2-H6]MCF2926670.1 hypothetical protein [Pseudoalteromonas sp. DL2-H1]NSY34697.1 hypothetical protein [Pseudoalteromonas sp. JC28]
MELIVGMVVFGVVLLTAYLAYKEVSRSHTHYKESASTADFTNVVDIEHYLECKALGLGSEVYKADSLASRTILLKRRDRLLEVIGK